MTYNFVFFVRNSFYNFYGDFFVKEDFGTVFWSKKWK